MPVRLDDPNQNPETPLLALSADVGRALTTRQTLAEMIQGCAEAIVTHLDAAFARVWVLDEAEDVLVLRASAGQYTHLDGPHGRVPVGMFKIGLIAQERQPHLTNAVVGDPRVSDQEWARREGMVSFAGYPLVVDDRLVGVVALFARRPLSEETLQALGSVADQIAVGVERLRADAERLASHERLVEVLESLGDGFYAVDADFRFTYVNGRAEALWGRPRSELLGRRLQDEFPQMLGSDSLALQERALAERAPTHYETASPILGRWIEVSAYPSGDGLSVYFRDISSRREAQDALRRFQLLVESANDALFLLDEAGRFLYVNAAACRSLGYTAEEFARMRAGDIDPLHDGHAYRDLFHRLGGERLAPFESLHRRKDGTTFPIEASVTRLDIGGQPLLFSSARDISERKAAEQALREAHQRTAGILESITDAFIALDSQWRFTDINDQAERVVFQKRAEILGRVFWDVFPETVGSTFERQYRRAVADGVSVAFEEFFPPLDTWFEVRAYPSGDGLSIFFQNINERRRAQAERERLLAEHQARLETEALAGRIGAALRSTLDPDLIQETAAAVLGEALGADRCFYLTYDQSRGVALMGRDFRRPHLPALAGEYRISDFETLLAEVFAGGGTVAVSDVRGALTPAVAAQMESFGHRAVLAVPFFGGGRLVAALWASADGPRAWTAQEAALMEQTATLTRTALEAAQVRAREHRIASDLQDALQPAVPAQVPGLTVGHFTRPALDEASVGGDFYDLFALDKELYALVIGDVSGKGLAAAQQLALIRNSLRTTLYLSHAPAQAAATLNKIVTAHELLAGFVTAWVGVYDAGTGDVVFCSCGHEPALIRRADGTVEELETTGPPLGVAEGAEFAQHTVTLSSGDCLLLYTDGLSEAGPSRRELLGTGGLIRMLATHPAEGDVQAQARALVGQVSAYANGVFRDDVAVLLLRRQ